MTWRRLFLTGSDEQVAMRVGPESTPATVDRGRRGRWLAWLGGAVVAAHLLIWLGGFGLGATLGVLLLTVAVPGVLLAGLLLHHAWPSPLEFALYSAGAGFTTLLYTSLLLTLWPGGLSPLGVILGFDAVILLMAGGWWLRSRRAPRHTATATATMPHAPHGLVVGALVSVLLIAALLRLPGLGYSDFQGDEARAMLRAAEAIQGYESALLIHKKGPVEILIPATLHATQTRITEAQARLPFALANLVGIAAIFVLGWRMFGLLAGWTASMLLAVEGYLIGFARIVQYQSVVFCMSALVLLILWRMAQMRKVHQSHFWLAGLFFATGFMSHYEALWVVIPGGFLLWRIGRSVGWRRLAAAALLPLLSTAALLAAYFVPFVLDERFTRTADDLLGNRLGVSNPRRFPYNNLPDFFARTLIYDSAYQFFLLIGLTVAAQVLTLRRHLAAWAVWLIGGLTVGGLLLTFLVDPGWLRPGGLLLTWLFFALAVGVVIGLPRLDPARRTVWLWFGVPMVLSLFFVAKPNSHVYGFFSGWALVAATAVEDGWGMLRSRVSLARARWATIPVAVLLVVLFANYAARLFLDQREVLRTWATNAPVGYWTPFAVPDSHSLFGFPYKNGWKVIGALYADGTLAAPFDTNETSRIADWYGRGLYFCPPDSAYYMVPTSLQPDAESRAEYDELIEELGVRGYQEMGVVTVDGDPRLRIFTTQPVEGDPRRFDEAAYAPYFDQVLATPDFVKLGPAINVQPAVAVDYRLGDAIRLRGYSVSPEPVTAGETLHLQLFWEATAPIDEEYTVFVQLIDLETLHKAAQRDSEPGCTKYAIDEWRTGELNLDPYTLTVAADAPPGRYTLLVGMYDDANERLPVFAADGSLIGDAIPLHTLEVQTP